jgi:hypothetical protein
MKRIIIYLLLIVASIGCKKDDLPTRTSAGDWVLVDAQLYIKRWGNYPLERYDLFSTTQNHNCLDVNGNEISLDNVYKDSTRWILPQNGGFILDSVKAYEVQSSPTFIRVYPTEDNSARIFVLDDLSDNFVRWKTSNREQALTFNGVTDNYTYFTKLIFKRKGTNDQYDLRADLEPSTYKGVLPGGLISDNVFKGHTWVIYKYKQEGFNSYQYINDTLYFITNRIYHLNTTQANQDLYYSVYNMGGYYTMDINHTRFGSNISCSNLPMTAVNIGDIQNAKFKDNTIGVNGTYYYLFMKKIN